MVKKEQNKIFVKSNHLFAKLRATFLIIGKFQLQKQNDYSYYAVVKKQVSH